MDKLGLGFNISEFIRKYAPIIPQSYWRKVISECIIGRDFLRTYGSYLSDDNINLAKQRIKEKFK